MSAPILRNCGLAIALAFLAAGPFTGFAAETLTYTDLVGRLADMEHLAVLPLPGEKGALASGYDRKSQYDATADSYIAWDANGDSGGFIRNEGEGKVMAEIQGPGCIWRIWSATAREGHVKIYLDGAESPTVDLPFIGYFDRTHEPFTRPNLVYTSARGLNNHTPIPFQKSCKIVAEKDWGSYYHFNYTTFPQGTVVPTFALPLSAKDTAALDAANLAMGQCGQDPAGSRPDQKTDTSSITVPAGGKSVAMELKGPQAITAIKVKLALPKDAEQQRTLLAQLTVSVTWDNESGPAIWSPLGDFFASAAGAVPFRTLPVGLSEDGTFYCYWYMPFSDKARIEVGNDSAQPVSMTWEVAHSPLNKPIETLGRFHAKWHRDAFLPTRKDRAIDWTLLTIEEKGRYVGTQLHVWNPLGGWWGEGDEKFFVDGEKFPSTFGTGSEDYFGYAWSSGGTFVQALHSQPVNQNNQGHVSVNRWHLADNIPFQTSFEGDIEKYYTNDRLTRYSAVAFWYLNAGGKDPYAAVDVSERIGWWNRPEAIQVVSGPSLVDGALTPKEPQHRPFSQTNAEALQVLVWPAESIGETLVLKLPMMEAGRYGVMARFNRAPNYGIVQLSMNGQKLREPIDILGWDPKASGDSNGSCGYPEFMGVVDLPAGESTLGVEIIGKRGPSKGFFFGLEYIKLIPVKPPGGPRP